MAKTRTINDEVELNDFLYKKYGTEVAVYAQSKAPELMLKVIDKDKFTEAVFAAIFTGLSMGFMYGLQEKGMVIDLPKEENEKV